MADILPDLSLGKPEQAMIEKLINAACFSLGGAISAEIRSMHVVAAFCFGVACALFAAAYVLSEGER